MKSAEAQIPSQRQGRRSLLSMLVLADAIPRVPNPIRLGCNAISVYEINDPQGFANSTQRARELIESKGNGQDVLTKLNEVSTAVEEDASHSALDPQVLAEARAFALAQCVTQADLKAAA